MCHPFKILAGISLLLAEKYHITKMVVLRSTFPTNNQCCIGVVVLRGRCPKGVGVPEVKSFMI